MARVTVEDCIKIVPNRFTLCLAAAERARNLASGAGKTIDANDKKSAVIALREIAAGTIDPDALIEKFISGSQRNPSSDADEDDDVVFDTMKTIGADDPQFRTIAERQAGDSIAIKDIDEANDDLDDDEE
jgi:DNA-directed RNA polymerase subunit omega